MRGVRFHLAEPLAQTVVEIQDQFPVAVPALDSSDLFLQLYSPHRPLLPLNVLSPLSALTPAPVRTAIFFFAEFDTIILL